MKKMVLLLRIRDPDSLLYGRLVDITREEAYSGFVKRPAKKKGSMLYTWAYNRICLNKFWKYKGVLHEATRKAIFSCLRIVVRLRKAIVTNSYLQFQNTTFLPSTCRASFFLLFFNP